MELNKPPYTELDLQAIEDRCIEARAWNGLAKNPLTHCLPDLPALVQEVRRLTDRNSVLSAQLALHVPSDDPRFGCSKEFAQLRAIESALRRQVKELQDTSGKDADENLVLRAENARLRDALMAAALMAARQKS